MDVITHIHHMLSFCIMSYVINKKDKDMTWYSFRQNNSGGRFLIDETVDIYVVVEETTMKKAIKKARSTTKNHRAYCNCCGERWSFYEGEIETFDEVPTNLDYSAVLYSLDESRTKIPGPPEKPSSWDRQRSAYTGIRGGSNMQILSLLLEHVDVSRLRIKLPPLINLSDDNVAISSSI